MDNDFGTVACTKPCHYKIWFKMYLEARFESVNALGYLNIMQ